MKGKTTVPGKNVTAAIYHLAAASQWGEDCRDIGEPGFYKM